MLKNSALHHRKTFLNIFKYKTVILNLNISQNYSFYYVLNWVNAALVSMKKEMFKQNILCMFVCAEVHFWGCCTRHYYCKRECDRCRLWPVLCHWIRASGWRGQVRHHTHYSECVWCENKTKTITNVIYSNFLCLTASGWYLHPVCPGQRDQGPLHTHSLRQGQPWRQFQQPQGKLCAGTWNLWMWIITFFF